MLNSKKNGSTDRPIETFEKDEFAIEAYIEVLSEFIEECERFRAPFEALIQNST